ncbi:response regulator [Paenibacillus thiaminolyticus]|uniref:Response regulator n=7 Tax=Paenibacillus thiaminolyticus TaxID=49283 RepID=A0AAP9J1L6_PANTH|nr:helix-turn-helix domain-containing protein [Paenibacillus thiaminolyticus]MCY9536448.1 response regulator [Paenibacillus thiaminolyticus]MCY9601460.1 response regulator [Paenibacillus thiaminolyticus]MCY9610208.1 response regulator [Paenibacillus thiaminolyticus]MCY9616488.1 response regulator [Paenibacillus thiaminolyticus]MCY9616901.1 response regulator [Paenibacillus thiaminolyticus]
MKVLIVDDEVIIRTGLAQVIPWNELGFEVLPPCASAEEAMEVIGTEKPHLVLTDIRMTGADGIALAAHIREVSPRTETLILTGYDDFHYARRALREGVCDYLLKTSRPDDIVKAALRAKARLLEKQDAAMHDSAKEASHRERQMLKLLTEPLPVEDCRRIAAELFRGDGAPQGSGSVASSYGTAPIDATVIEAASDETAVINAASYEAAVIEAAGWGEARHGLLLFAAANLLAELLGGPVIRHAQLLLALRRTEPVPGRLPCGWDEALRRTEQLLKCRLFAGIGGAAADAADIGRSCREAGSAGRFRWFAAGRRLLHYEETAAREGRPSICSAQEEDSLLQALSSGRPERLRLWIGERVKELIAHPHATPESIRSYGQSALIAAERWLERCAQAAAPLNRQAAEAWDGWSWQPHALADPAAAVPEQWEGSLFAALQEAMQIYRDRYADDAVPYVSRAMRYIRETADGSLTLQHVASVVNVHPNHLSDKFKQETGMNYIEYVTQARIARACRLLQDGSALVSDTARMVGYEDLKYFSQLFKKHMGCTPSEYRSSRSGGAAGGSNSVPLSDPAR